jgi:hypothetical protein
MIIIDPPVTPFSSPEEIRAWIERLQEMRQEVAEEPESVAAVDRELALAQSWLQPSPRAE